MCGIGGRTIEEAQNNLSCGEFNRWAEYRQKRGSLHPGMRIEHAGALIAQMMANRYREKGAAPFTIFDFGPHIDEPELSIDDLKDWE